MQDFWIYAPVLPATHTRLGNGCPGSAGIPSLDPAPFNLPWLGATFDLQLTNLPPNAPTSLLVGVSSSQWGGLTLPFNLGVLQMPGCTLFSSGEAVLSATATGGTATFRLPLFLPSLPGGTFYNQGFVLDPGANPAGVTASNATQSVVGVR